VSLRIKFSIFAVLLVAVVIVAIAWFSFTSERRMLIEQIVSGEDAIVQSLAKVCEESLITEDDLLAVNYIKDLIRRESPSVVHAMFVSTDGRIAAYSDPEKLGTNIPGELARLIDKQVLAEKAGVTMRHSFDIQSSRTLFGHNQPTLLVWRPVVIHGEQRGTSHVGFDQEVRESAIRTTLAQARVRVFQVAGFGLIFGIIGSIVLAHTMTRPIKALERGAVLIGQGKLDTQIAITSHDELGKLARQFNDMAVKLKELDQMKDDFVSSVTHELRSPLTAIKGYVNFMLEGRSGNLTEKQQEFLTIVKSNTARLGRFIDDILDLAKFEAGRMDLHKEPTSIKSAAEEIVQLLRPLADEKKINLSIEAPETLPDILADPDKIRQIITNLVGNALKFTPDNGCITVRVQEQPKELLVSISDTGIGIPEEAKDKIFSKFEQVKGVRQRTKGPKGTGLGLAIAKGIVEGHGGKIWVESKLDKGSTFFFTLPKGGAVTVPKPSSSGFSDTSQPQSTPPSSPTSDTGEQNG